MEQQISCMEEREMTYFQAVWVITFLWVNKEMINYMEEQKMTYCKEDKELTISIVERNRYNH